MAPTDISLMLAEYFWGKSSGCEHSEAVGGVFQQWRQQQWATSRGAGLFCYFIFLKTSMACRLWFMAGENAQLMVVTVLKKSIL